MRILITAGDSDISGAIVSKLETEIQSEKLRIFSPPKRMLDVTSPGSVTTWVSEVQPDVIINVAGFIDPKPIQEIGVRDYEKHFGVNFFGTFLTCREGIKQGCKSFINIVSTSGWEGKANWSMYCASKAAVISFSESLMKEGYLCTTISPGRTDTKMRHGLFPDEDKTTLMSTKRIAELVQDILFNNKLWGCHIIETKENRHILPPRSCPK